MALVSVAASADSVRVQLDLRQATVPANQAKDDMTVRTLAAAAAA
jgi:hypothetical protein